MPILKDQREELFCQGIAKGMTQDAAYFAAGFSGKNQNVASASASRMLKRVRISARVDELKGKVAEKTEISMERLAEELRRIALSDIRDVVTFGPDGVRLKEGVTLTPAQAAMIAEVSETDKGQRVKLHAKLDAIDKLAKMFGYYAPEKVSLSMKLEDLVGKSFGLPEKK